MAEIVTINKAVSQDDRISTLLSNMHAGEPVKFVISGRTSVLMDEITYDGLIETIRILQENPTIIHSLNEREQGVFVDEKDIHEYV